MKAICETASGKVLVAQIDPPAQPAGRVVIDLDAETAAAAQRGAPLLWNGVSTVTADLEVLKAQAKARIDQEAEAFCQSFVTPGDTQMVRYKRKEELARAWVADNSTPVPMLAAEAAGTGVSLAALVAQVIAMADAWNSIMDVVEGARIAAKVAVANATTVAAIDEAAMVDWSGLLA